MLYKLKNLEGYQKVLLLGGVIFLITIITLGLLVGSGKIENPLSQSNKDNALHKDKPDPHTSGGTSNLTGGHSVDNEPLVEDEYSIDAKRSKGKKEVEVASVEEDGAGRLLIKAKSIKGSKSNKGGKKTKTYVYNTDSIIYDGKYDKIGNISDLKKGKKLEIYSYDEPIDTTRLSSKEAKEAVDKDLKESYIKAVIVNGNKKIHYVEPTEIYRTNTRLYYVDDVTKTKYTANRGIKSSLIGGNVDIVETRLVKGQMMFVKEGKAGTGHEFNDEIEAQGGLAGDFRPSEISPSKATKKAIKNLKDYKTIEIGEVYINDVFSEPEYDKQ